MSQCLAYNKSSGVNEMKTALECIEKSIKIKQDEKIFQDSSSPTLVMLNIHNASEAYESQLKFVKSQLKNLLFDESVAVKTMLERGLEICQIQEELVRQEKIPKERITKQDEEYFMGNLDDEDERSIEIIENMFGKIKDIIDLNKSREEPDKVKAAYKEYQRVMDIYQPMKFWYNYDFRNKQNQTLQEEAKALGVDLDSNR